MKIAPSHTPDTSRGLVGGKMAEVKTPVLNCPWNYNNNFKH